MEYPLIRSSQRYLILTEFFQNILIFQTIFMNPKDKYSLQRSLNSMHPLQHTAFRRKQACCTLIHIHKQRCKGVITQPSCQNIPSWHSGPCQLQRATEDVDCPQFIDSEEDNSCVILGLVLTSNIGQWGFKSTTHLLHNKCANSIKMTSQPTVKMLCTCFYLLASH